VAWLLELFDDEAVARVAGRAFGAITGIDLRASKLDGARPDGARAQPSDDPNDEDVSVDPDASLPWPNAVSARAAWPRAAARFPRGQRLFLGKPSSADWVSHVLRAGDQHQRRAAAFELALASPGTPLFEVRAPAFRQR
jgi:uncharacterized protein (TIGR02270 family)